jgi:hypothetical protein
MAASTARHFGPVFLPRSARSLQKYCTRRRRILVALAEPLGFQDRRPESIKRPTPTRPHVCSLLVPDSRPQIPRRLARSAPPDPDQNKFRRSHLFHESKKAPGRRPVNPVALDAGPLGGARHARRRKARASRCLDQTKRLAAIGVRRCRAWARGSSGANSDTRHSWRKSGDISANEWSSMHPFNI